jgi:hypothetical protein
MNYELWAMNPSFIARSVFDIETRVSPGGPHLLFFNRSDVPVRRASRKFRAKVGHLIGRPFGDSFDSAVGEIAHRADDAHSPRSAYGKEAEAHALHSAFNYESPGYHCNKTHA